MQMYAKIFHTHTEMFPIGWTVAKLNPAYTESTFVSSALHTLVELRCKHVRFLIAFLVLIGFLLISNTSARMYIVITRVYWLVGW